MCYFLNKFNLMKSKSLDNYIIKLQLGKGSFGNVYLGVNKLTKREYVLKLINTTDIQEENKKPQDSFIEYEIQKKFNNSERVVKVYDSFLEKTNFIIVMEYCNGGNLHEYIRMNQNLSLEKILNIFSQIALGIKEIHDKNIIHRDIKTMNIFIKKPEFSVKIGDFGSAKLMGYKCFANTIIGTPYYLSPEICEEKPYTLKSDIWCLGIILFELITGTYPFKSQNFSNLKMKIVKDNVLSVSDENLISKLSFNINSSKNKEAYNKDHCKKLIDLLNLLLKKNPNSRPNINAIIDYLNKDFNLFKVNSKSKSGNIEIIFIKEEDKKKEILKPCKNITNFRGNQLKEILFESENDFYNDDIVNCKLMTENFNKQAEAKITKQLNLQNDPIIGNTDTSKSLMKMPKMKYINVKAEPVNKRVRIKSSMNPDSRPQLRNNLKINNNIKRNIITPSKEILKNEIKNSGVDVRYSNKAIHKKDTKNFNNCFTNPMTMIDKFENQIKETNFFLKNNDYVKDESTIINDKDMNLNNTDVIENENKENVSLLSTSNLKLIADNINLTAVEKALEENHIKRRQLKNEFTEYIEEIKSDINKLVGEDNFLMIDDLYEELSLQTCDVKDADLFQPYVEEIIDNSKLETFYELFYKLKNIQFKAENV